MNIEIPTRFGLIALRSWSNDSFDSIDTEGFQIHISFLDLDKIDQAGQKRIIQEIADQIEDFAQNQSNIINHFINKDFLTENQWLEKTYQYKFNDSFPLEDFKKSFELKGIWLTYDHQNFGEVKDIRPTFYPHEKYSFGFELIFNDFLSIEKTPKPFIYFNTDFNSEACLNVLRTENEADFSLRVLFFLAFMEGCIHQGTLYGASGYITGELIKCISTCHSEAKLDVVRLIYNLQYAFMEGLEYLKPEEIDDEWKRENAENELKYGQEVNQALLTHKALLEKWKDDEEFGEGIRYILENIKN